MNRGLREGRSEFEKKLISETLLSLDDLPDHEEGFYDDFINEDGEIDYDLLIDEM